MSIICCVLNLPHKNLRLALPVIQRLLLRGQRRDVGLVEAALDEPVRGARGEHEQFLHPLRLREAGHMVEDDLAVAAVAALRVHREAGQFGGGLVGERVQRGAADDAVVVFQHHEARDFALQ